MGGPRRRVAAAAEDEVSVAMAALGFFWLGNRGGIGSIWFRAARSDLEIGGFRSAWRGSWAGLYIWGWRKEEVRRGVRAWIDPDPCLNRHGGSTATIRINCSPRVALVIQTDLSLTLVMRG